MINNLIPMVDFVLLENDINVIKNYANFIKQKPEKWMFFPCDEDGNVLEESLDYDDNLCRYCSLDKKGVYGTDGGYMAGCEGSKCNETREYYSEQYQQAKERVLFEHEHNDVDLFIYWLVSLEHISLHHLKLTETAKNIIYGNSR